MLHSIKNQAPIHMYTKPLSWTSYFLIRMTESVQSESTFGLIEKKVKLNLHSFESKFKLN